MSWAVGFDERWNRDIGYGVPAYCDHPKCDAVIYRGLPYVCCDQQPYGGDRGCGLYFCPERVDVRHRCSPCAHGREPYKAKPDHPDWLRWKLEDDSWAEWRQQNPVAVAEARAVLAGGEAGTGPSV